jgi:hypothetical protein
MYELAANKLGHNSIAMNTLPEFVNQVFCFETLFF